MSAMRRGRQALLHFTRAVGPCCAMEKVKARNALRNCSKVPWLRKPVLAWHSKSNAVLLRPLMRPVAMSSQRLE